MKEWFVIQAEVRQQKPFFLCELIHSAFKKLVRMRYKLMTWFTFRPHFTRRVSFSPEREKSGRKTLKIAVPK